MKKKILAVFLSLCMAMSLLPVTALATDAADEETPSTQATTLPEAENGVITLEGDVELAATYTVATGKNIKLDLNGHTISPATGFAGGHLITVSEGGSLTLTDSVGNGKIESKESSVRGILNHGTFNMDSGAINVYNYAVTNEVTQTSYNNNQPIICNITGGELSASYAWTIFLKGAGIAGQTSGSSQGINYNGQKSIRNDLIQTSIAGNAEVTGIQAITTNASNGIYAGFTLNISGNARIVDKSASDSAIYLPAVGVTTISENAYISGAQGIRFCAGELTITGGTIVGTAVSDEEDLIAGGSGGTKGAIVIGKAGGGYVGDITVNISGTAEVVNTAEGTADDTRPAIVVSDKNMGDESKGYDDLSISVNVDGATITGDVVKVSNLSSTNTQDGGNTSLMIQNTTVKGDVTNQSKTGLTVKDSTITGNVTNTSEGNTALLNTTVQGDVKDDEGGAGSIYKDSDPEQTGNVVAINETTSKTYTSLQEAINAAQSGDTIILLKAATLKADITISKNITIDGQGKYEIDAQPQNSHAITVAAPNAALTLKDVTLNITDQKEQTGTYGLNVQYGATLTLDNADVTLAGLSNATISSNPNSAGTEPGKFVLTKGSTITANDIGGNFSNGGTWTIGAGSKVTIDGCASHGFSASAIIVKDGGTVDVRNTGYRGISINDANGKLEIQAGGVVNVTNAGTADGPATPRDAVYLSDKATEGLIVKAGATLNVTAGKDGNDRIELSKDAVSKSELNGTIIGTVDLPEDASHWVVTYKDNGKNWKVKLVDKNNATISLPTLSNQGYNHFVGWNDGTTTYAGGTKVTISKDTTFTAVWSYIPPANPNYRIDIPDFEGGTVTADPAAAKAGAEVTLTATPDEGYALGSLTVTDRFGDAVKVTENADGTYTFTMPNGQVTVKATFVETEEPAPAEPFPDVDENDWFYDEVVYVYENGLMNGVENNQFAPNTATNRAMLATILYRLAGQPDVSGDLPFTDVAAGTWYTDAVLWAAQNGIVNGLGENTFAPMNTLTREQLVTMLYRYAEAEGYDVSAAADLSGYPDAGKVQPYAQEAMTWAVAEGIVEGMDGNLNPAGSATRAQIATILMRFCEGVAK